MKQRTPFLSRLPALVVAIVILALWQIAGMRLQQTHILPAPSDILIRTWQLRETLFLHHLPATLATVLPGWLLSILIGTLLAVLMHRSRTMEAMLHPVLVVTQTIPVMCISPLFVLWMGYTVGARLLAVVLSTFFSITLNTYEGLRRTDPGRRELLRTYGAGQKEIFWKLELPSALPRFMTALKMTAPWAVVDAAAAEWLGANQGLGYFSRRMISTMDGAGVFAPILILTVIALLLVALVQMLDHRLVTWRSQMAGG